MQFYWRFVVNKGGEAPGYMEYILQRFDTLPEWMVFLHGRQDQHCRWWYGLLRCLDSKHLAHRGHPFYISLNDVEYYKENVGIHMNVGQGLKFLYELWEIAKSREPNQIVAPSLRNSWLTVLHQSTPSCIL